MTRLILIAADKILLLIAASCLVALFALWVLAVGSILSLLLAL